MFAVAVQNTETLHMTLMGPYKTEALANLVCQSFTAEMDARCDFTVVHSVWVVPMRSMNTEMTMFRSLIALYDRTEAENRGNDNYAQLDV